MLKPYVALKKFFRNQCLEVYLFKTFLSVMKHSRGNMGVKTSNCDIHGSLDLFLVTNKDLANGFHFQVLHEIYL